MLPTSRGRRRTVRGDRGRRRLSDLLGLTGEPAAGGPWAAALDLVAMVAALAVTVLACRALGLGGWPAVLIGGCAAAATGHLGPGARLVRRRRAGAR
ncbi:hypothetical protein AB0O91_35300 [Kitasatospora sp. NPDC089797]|uniref:hypothetical protein n=1 Tax=Kitasatospora sp. NPDC089797 TaxID=3155298 RepID=UPI00342B8F0D